MVIGHAAVFGGCAYAAATAAWGATGPGQTFGCALAGKLVVASTARTADTIAKVNIGIHTHFKAETTQLWDFIVTHHEDGGLIDVKRLAACLPTGLGGT